MMRIAATVVILAVLASITWHMTKSLAYFVCDGVMTINGTDQQEPVRRASLTVEVAPALVRLLFSSGVKLEALTRRRSSCRAPIAMA
jgi:hypothetical protein